MGVWIYRRCFAMSELLRLEGISKSFPAPDGSQVRILSGLDLSLEEGEVISIVGRSGSGKSTLLSIAALLLSPDSGRILYGGRDTSSLTSREVSSLRSMSMGFIFQSSILLEDFSALENVAMPLLIQGRSRREAFPEAERLLMKVGLSERMGYRPGQLSGGERQRVAIARALSPSPSVVFADEPTGSLDERSAADIESLLLSAVRSEGRGMIIVTHDRNLAERADRMLLLSEGRLSDEGI